MTPTFSIIIPVYNVAPYLRECLDSVLHQTFENWEAICVDDGSTDESGAILDEYGAKDNRFKVIHQQNGGVSSARNKALQVAVAEQILFLDADDIYNVDLLCQVNICSVGNPNAEIIGFQFERFVDSKDVHWGNTKITVKEIDIETSVPLTDLLYCFWTKVYKRNVLPSHGFRSYTRGEDLLFLLECICRAKTILILNKKLYAYRNRLGSAVNSPVSLRLLEDMRYSVPERLSLIVESGKIFPRRFIRNMFHLATYQFVDPINELDPKYRDYAWRLWQDMIREIRENLMAPFVIWQRCVISILVKIKNKSVIFLICHIYAMWMRIVNKAYRIVSQWG